MPRGALRPDRHLRRGHLASRIGWDGLLLAGVLAGVAGLLLARLARAPMQPYGSDSAHYIEHEARLKIADLLAQRAQSGYWWDVLGDIDGFFPPLLHLVTLTLSPVTGLRAEDIAWTGLLWWAVLGACVGLLGWLVTGRRRAGIAACIACLLLPAAHGFALRYYYDLPMTAVLWTLPPLVVASWDRRPLRGGVLVGLAMATACLLKWTALPLGMILVAGAVLCRRVGPDGPETCAPRSRILALGVAVAVCCAVLGAYLGSIGPENSLTNMLGEISADAFPSRGGGRSIPGHVTDLLAPTGPRLLFYPQTLVTAIVSPLLALFLLPLLAWWAIRDRRALPLGLGVPLVTWLFFLLRVPPMDERFSLSFVPALVLAAVLGWDHLGPRLRRGVGLAFVVAGLAVAVDFHAVDFLGRVDEPEDCGWPGSDARGRGVLGLWDSQEQRGWSSFDRTLDDQNRRREEVWSVIASCEAATLRLQSEHPLVDPCGDTNWLNYRNLLARLSEGRPERSVLPMCDPPLDDRPELAVTLAPSGAASPLPACTPGDGWELERVVSIAAGGEPIALWSRGGPCCGPEAVRSPHAPSTDPGDRPPNAP